MSKENAATPATRKEKRTAVALRLKEFAELSNRAIARQLGVSHTYVAKIRAELGIVANVDRSDVDWLNHPHLVAHPELLDGASDRTLRALRAPGVLDLMQARGIGARYAQAILRREVNEEREKAAKKLTAADVDLRCDDIMNGLEWIADESVDCVIVDPPYDRTAVKSELYKAIAEVSARVLKPGAALVIMTGHAHLDVFMSQIAEVTEMRYLWMLHYITRRGGGSPRFETLGATSFGKPVLVYLKGSRTWTGKPYSDVIDAAPPDRTAERLHPHQQDLHGMSELVKRFSEPGDTVLDMCVGSGTTGVACVKLRRKFVGIDIDAGHVNVARTRIVEELNSQSSIPI